MSGAGVALQFTHVAGYHAGQIIRPMLFGLPSKVRTDHVPWATYTDPELAQVGLTEGPRRARSTVTRLFVPRAGRSSTNNDRPIATGQWSGFPPRSWWSRGGPWAPTIVGPAGGPKLIQIWALAIAKTASRCRPSPA